MNRKLPPVVLPTREARIRLPEILATFRRTGARADPVVIGARRRPEAVVISYEAYLELVARTEQLPATLEQAPRPVPELPPAALDQDLGPVPEQLPAGTPTTAATPEGRQPTECQVVLFSLHGESYALPISAVREIIPYTPPQARGAAVREIAGMIALRGRILPVVHLAGHMGDPVENGNSTRILVIELERGPVALPVDRVEEVVALDAAQIEPIPGGLGTVGRSVATIGDRLVAMVDPELALGSALTP